jgi:hypothetical protein
MPDRPWALSVVELEVAVDTDDVGPLDDDVVPPVGPGPSGAVAPMVVPVAIKVQPRSERKPEAERNEASEIGRRLVVHDRRFVDGHIDHVGTHRHDPQ